jgi:hypothetical protein
MGLYIKFSLRAPYEIELKWPQLETAYLGKLTLSRFSNIKKGKSLTQSLNQCQTTVFNVGSEALKLHAVLGIRIRMFLDLPDPDSLSLFL